MRNFKFFILSLCFFFFSLTAFAQTYYELAYKNQAGKQCYGFMIYEDDENVSMRVVELSADNDVTAADDIPYNGEQGSEDGQQYTALAPMKQASNAPYIVFFWNKLKGSNEVEILPAICYDLTKNDFKDPDSFTEVGLADITAEYLQQFYNVEDPVYQSIMTAQKEILDQRITIASNLGDGSDIYRTVLTLLAEAGATVDTNMLSDQGSCSTGTCAPSDEDDSDDDDDPSSSDFYNGSNTLSNNSGVTLHFVSVINATVNDIGSSCERDYDNIKSEMKGISQALGIRMRNYNVMGNNYSREGVVQTLQELAPAANDIVFFLYSGHGFRFNDQESSYPAIDLTSSSYDNIEENHLLMSDIYDEICSKNARLNIVLSDCCNTPIGIETPPMRECGTLYCRASNNFSVSRLGQLFLQERGNMLSTAASPGETSICDMMGGVYTLAFIRSLRKEINATNQQDVSWNSVINNTISSARERSQEAGNRQHGLKETTIRR